MAVEVVRQQRLDDVVEHALDHVEAAGHPAVQLAERELALGGLGQVARSRIGGAPADDASQ